MCSKRRISAVVFLFISVVTGSALSQELNAIPLQKWKTRHQTELEWSIALVGIALDDLAWPKLRAQFTEEQENALRALDDYYNEGLRGIWTREEEENGTMLQTWATLQRERAAEVLQAAMKIYGDQWNRVIWYGNRQELKGRSNSDPTFLTNRHLADEIGLAAGQRADIAEAIKDSVAEIKADSEQLLRDLEELEREHFRTLKSQLDGRQRRRFDELFGDWLRWDVSEPWGRLENEPLHEQPDNQ